MRTPQRLCAAILLLLLKYNEVLAYTLSVPSDTVAVGQTFVLSWTSSSNDLQDVDICLNTNTEFLRIGSIQRSNQLEGMVDVTVNKSITPGTYTLGIRAPGCSFLFAQHFNDFVVTAPAPTSTTSSTSTMPQSTQSHTSSASSPPHPSSRTSSTSAAPATPTSSSTFQENSAAGVHSTSDSGSGSGINTGSTTSVMPTAASVIPTAQSQTNSQTTSVGTPVVTSPDSSTTPSSGALGITESIWGKGMIVQFVGYMFGVLMVFL
ncbi:hypothetical protein BYT27DRAFT_7263803 [Phlegmacium glaucopus]|nr:hypothetical protein BYT27DRAFT_7263803 [Phlegmacium glaucopus]